MSICVVGSGVVKISEGTPRGFGTGVNLLEPRRIRALFPVFSNLYSILSGWACQLQARPSTVACVHRFGVLALPVISHRHIVSFHVLGVEARNVMNR